MRAVQAGPSALSKVKLLIDRGANIHTRDHVEATILHHAVNACGSVDVCELILNLGFDVSVVDVEGNTPLHYALRWPNSEWKRVASLLLERGASLDTANQVWIDNNMMW
jgi:ankyrin repeat protein